MSGNTELQEQIESSDSQQNHSHEYDYFKWGVVIAGGITVVALCPSLGVGIATYAATNPEETCQMMCSIVGENTCFCGHHHH